MKLMSCHVLSCPVLSCPAQVALKTKGIQFSQYPVENEASLRNTLHQLLADSQVRRKQQRQQRGCNGAGASS